MTPEERVELTYEHSKGLTLALVTAADRYFDKEGATVTKLQGSEQTLVLNYALSKFRMSSICQIIEDETLSKKQVLSSLKTLEEDYTFIFTKLLQRELNERFKSQSKPEGQ